jgi:DNA (cytosine-5)-methyltransferase 1
MKILNLYCGIGGNRKLWTPKGDEHQITAVELEPDIAKIYQDFFPKDKVVVADAHQYLLEHFQEFDFIWSSPPCQSHSKTNFFLKGQGIFRYPDMKLYEEIIFLKYFFKGKYVVENVQGYYKPLVEPQKIGRHYFWSNFKIQNIDIDYVQIGTMNRQASKNAQRKAIIREAQIPELIDLHGLKDFKLKNKRQVLRNCVYPELGLHILKEAFKITIFMTGTRYDEPNKLL